MSPPDGGAVCCGKSGLVGGGGGEVEAVLTHHVQQELDAKLLAEVLPVPGHEGGHVLDVTNLQVELRPRPYSGQQAKKDGRNLNCVEKR